MSIYDHPSQKTSARLLREAWPHVSGIDGLMQSLLRLHILPLKKIACGMRHRLRPPAYALFVPTAD
jgi:hypothetical protein